MKLKSIVLGLGVSGVAAARFLIKQGSLVIGIDERCAHLEMATDSLSSLQQIGVHLQSESEPIDWSEIKELIVSPGISPQHPFYVEAAKRLIPIRGEAELALSHFNLEAVAVDPLFKRKLVAITGTNGKTTVTLLVEHILNHAGISAKALGNVGEALCDYLLSAGMEQVCVVELSSYQLETMRTPVFDAAVLLNITPDHLDRYSSMQEYAKAKCHLESLLLPNAPFFVQKSVALEYPHLLRSPRLFEWDPSETVASLLPIVYKNRGRHACENALAAWGICHHLGVSASTFTQGLETFQTPPHRIEWVSEVKGVSYYDDSKGTNIDAVIQAVNSMQSDVVLIVGGVDKGASYLPWKEPFANKVKHLVAIGQAAEKIERELNPYFAITRVDSLEKAVILAADLAKKGDCVLLSPGCSSFDMFRDYAHRGEEFQKHVKNL